LLRLLTRLLFYDPVAERARHAAFGGITPIRGVGARRSRRARHVNVFHNLIYNGIV
jgi:hypothetical protein